MKLGALFCGCGSSLVEIVSQILQVDALGTFLAMFNMNDGERICPAIAFLNSFSGARWEK